MPNTYPLKIRKESEERFDKDAKSKKLVAFRKRGAKGEWVLYDMLFIDDKAETKEFKPEGVDF